MAAKTPITLFLCVVLLTTSSLARNHNGFETFAMPPHFGRGYISHRVASEPMLPMRTIGHPSPVMPMGVIEHPSPAAMIKKHIGIELPSPVAMIKKHIGIIEHPSPAAMIKKHIGIELPSPAAMIRKHKKLSPKMGSEPITVQME